MTQLTIPAGQAAAAQQTEQPLYSCSVCGEPVIVFNGNSFRTCEHTDAAVMANMDAIVRSTSGLQ